MRLTWEGHGFSELGAMQREARPLVEAGRYEDAEHKLRESLTGFEYLFSSINECTLSVAYDLAELYSQSARMIDADAVLQWMSEQLVETFGLDHQKTTSHMVHVVDLYQKWGRTNDAVTVLLRAMEFLDRPPNPSNAEAALFGQNNKYERMTANPDEQVYRSSTFSRYVEISDGSGQKDAGHSLEFQLCVANARVRAKDPETEPLLLRLIEQCEELPGQLEVLILKSRTSLIDLYLQLEKPQELASALEIAKERFFIIMKQKKPSSLSLLDAGVDLAGMYVKASHYKEADAMFSQIENELTGTAGDDDCDNAIDFLIDIGMLYESHNRWNDARARFEHALALTLSSRGSESRLGRRLQTALDNRHFSMSSLQQLEYKSSLRKRLMEY
jgi:tetratricopeptide (TPR) repeat protein